MLAAERGQRCSQLVRGVGREAPALRERLLEVREHVVHGLGEPVQPSPVPRPLHAPAEILGADAPGGSRHPIERAQRDLRDERAAQRGQSDSHRDQDGQGVQVPVQGRRGRAAASMPTWTISTTRPSRTTGIVRIRDRLRSRRARRSRRCSAPGPPAPAPRVTGGARRRGAGAGSRGAALGIQELEKLVVELGSQQLPQQRLGSPAARAGRVDVLATTCATVRSDASRSCSRPTRSQRVRQRPDRHDDGQEHRAVPEGQPGANGERRAREPHASAPSM